MDEAVSVVITKGNKYLLIKRAKAGVGKGYWCPVSGSIEEGETQGEAAIRESLEEVGLKVIPIRKVWECPTKNRDYRLHWWTVRAENYTIKARKDEVDDYGWFTAEEIKNLDKMFEADRKFFLEKNRNTGGSP